MKIYIKGFQRKWEDTIAVIYRLGKTKTAISPKLDLFYQLEDDKLYLIICGLQEFRVENGEITRTFCSKRHPFHELNL